MSALRQGWFKRRRGLATPAPERPEQLVGKTGRLLVRVKGGEAPGELLLQVQGAPAQYLAYGKDRIEAGSTVLVVHDRGARSVDVVPWQLAPGPP